MRNFEAPERFLWLQVVRSELNNHLKAFSRNPSEVVRYIGGIDNMKMTGIAHADSQ
uniref:AlNc14C59G4369 protein n=1 Tax=Albugo laibachii Nc14 TaxID=890382 RepID=F0WCI9_9STRA|nr:AlNc14C59G4369 [Albugo laibachii Nc14]|eukprot:CCA18906.1 AlNc14C59G4369 [Albugo laibachii Nc14]